MRSLPLLLTLFALGNTHAAAPAAPPSEMRTLLAELIAVDTSNPPGNETAAAQVAARWLREAGIEAEIIEPAPGRGNLLARLKGSGRARPLLVLAHLDTVPAQRQEWTTDPWQLTERDSAPLSRQPPSPCRVFSSTPSSWVMRDWRPTNSGR